MLGAIFCSADVTLRVSDRIFGQCAGVIQVFVLLFQTLRITGEFEEH